MPPTIVLVHGLWLTPRSWEAWKARFEARGHEVLAPAWPRMAGEVEELRRDPSVLNGLGVVEVVDHYEQLIRGLRTPPVIMGHSFGGLVTEMLLDRGLGAVGVALSPAQIKGVLRLPPAQFRTVFRTLRNPANRKKTIELTPKEFHWAFTNAMMSDEEAQAAYERYAVPGPGRVLFEAGFANANPRAVTKVDVHKDSRAPLLVIGNTKDHTVPASVSKAAAKRQAKSRAVVEYVEYPGRPHFPTASGWEPVADHALDWAIGHAEGTASKAIGSVAPERATGA
jgi:pimeloyl-ACP methyl ester carboxylesterase